MLQCFSTSFTPLVMKRLHRSRMVTSASPKPNLPGLGVMLSQGQTLVHLILCLQHSVIRASHICTYAFPDNSFLFSIMVALTSCYLQRTRAQHFITRSYNNNCLQVSTMQSVHSPICTTISHTSLSPNRKRSFYLPLNPRTSLY